MFKNSRVVYVAHYPEGGPGDLISHARRLALRRLRFWPLLATWRSGYAAACKAVYTGSIPVVALPWSPLVLRESVRLAAAWARYPFHTRG